jgi:hypothetical protein
LLSNFIRSNIAIQALFPQAHSISLPKVGQGLGWVGMVRKVYEVEKREVFLRAFMVVLCLLGGRVHLELYGLEISGNLCRFLIH